MKFRQRNSLAAGIAAVLVTAALGFSTDSMALGLGDATVESYLDEPLRAHIDLISGAEDDLATVTARLASAADYELIGASRESVSVPIRFSIEDVDGDAYILATSNLPVADPVVRLIVEVNWSSGRMLREYTLFLDPAAVPAPAPLPRIDQRKPVAAPSPVSKPAQPAATTSPAVAAPATESRGQAAALASGAEYGPVRSGETLWRIASDYAGDSGLNVNQVMIAIQRENPQAFLNDNINLLKRGAILRLPDMKDVRGISTTSAYREVAEQEAAFRAGRSVAASAPVSAASADTPLLAEESAAPVSAIKTNEAVAEVEAPAEASSALAEEAAAAEPLAAEEAGREPEPVQDQLELVPPSADSELDSNSGYGESPETADADPGVQALQENLARTEEELVSQQQQNAYLEERIRELESQLEQADGEGVADADMANMQQRVQAQRQSEAAQAADAEQPWYGRMAIWLVGLLVVVAAFIGWLWSRRTAGDAAAEAAAEESLHDIQQEAEDVLRVLAEPGQKEPAGEQAVEETVGDAGEEAAEPAQAGAGPAAGAGSDDATVLDEDSSDPEIQLDLARAYISMGDKEAARVILEEVRGSGSEAQQEEARKMLDLLATG